MEQNLAIILNGGGARGSYQAGVLRAIYEIIKKDQNLFDIITGNSAGAINAIFLASNARDWGSSTQYLVDLWSRIKPENIYDINHFNPGRLGSKLVKSTIFLKGTENGVALNALFDTTPLRKLLVREINFDEIHNLIKSKIINAVALSTTNYHSGANVIFYDSNTVIEDWAKFDRFSIRSDLKVEHVMSSSAIPLFFPPAQIDKSFYGDGCIRQITPLSPAINLGANKIISIGIRHHHSIAKMKELTLSSTQAPMISQVGGVIMNAIFLDSLDADVERLEKVNAIAKIMGSKSPWKHIPILTLRPSRDIGLMTEKLDKELPVVIRYFLRSIGVSGQSGLDLLSYLAFDSSYTKQLVELGYEDTMSKKKEILNFIDSQ